MGPGNLDSSSATLDPQDWLVHWMNNCAGLLGGWVFDPVSLLWLDECGRKATKLMGKSHGYP